MNIHPALTLILAATAALLPHRAHADGAPTNGLIHQWHFDEGKGTTAYGSVGNWDFTLYNGAAFTTSGLKSPGVQLDGSNDFLSTKFVDTSFLNGGYTLSFWTLLQHLDPVYTEGLVALGANPIGITPTGNPTFSSNGSLGESSISINDRRWHLLSIVVSGGVERLYVDSTNTAIAKFATGTSQGFFQFGLTNQNYLYGGLIDEVSIYNRALSPAEIAQAAAAPEPSAAFLFIGALGAFLPRRRGARRSGGARRE